MRILFLALDIDLDRQRGDSIHTLELVSALDRRGVHITLVTGAGEGGSRFPAGVSHLVAPRRGSARLALWCARVARNSRSDAVYERRFSAKIGVAVRALCQIPLVLEVNGLLDLEATALGRQASNVPPRIGSMWYQHLFRNVDGVVAVTEGIRDALGKRHGVDLARVRVIANGANTDLFRPLDRDRCKEDLGLQGSTVVSFAGELYPWQGVDILIQAIHIVSEGHPRTEAVIVGDGPERRRLEALARELEAPVRFIGRVRHEEVPKYLGAATAVAVPKQPFASGTSPLKVYEALACGRAVVASNVPGLEFVGEEGCGFLVDPTDPKAWADAISTLLSDAQVGDGMGRRGRTLTEKRFSWDATAANVERFLREVVGNWN